MCILGERFYFFGWGREKEEVLVIRFVKVKKYNEFSF